MQCPGGGGAACGGAGFPLPFSYELGTHVERRETRRGRADARDGPRGGKDTQKDTSCQREAAPGRQGTERANGARVSSCVTYVTNVARSATSECA